MEFYSTKGPTYGRSLGGEHKVSEISPQASTGKIPTRIRGVRNNDYPGGRNFKFQALTPISNDLDNFEVLTPAHFLIGRSVNSCLEPP
ncbi:hypothetical protein TNCV_1324601 [Trichonephila clavipes]|nr:hypothetical protein TNCV_1324601 [Trichonephila clavipes]